MQNLLHTIALALKKVAGVCGCVPEGPVVNIQHRDRKSAILGLQIRLHPETAELSEKGIQ